MNERNGSSGGLGCAGTLTLIFIVLKLVGTIDWSWWWVLAPTWIPIAIVAGILAFAVFVKFLDDHTY